MAEVRTRMALAAALVAMTLAAAGCDKVMSAAGEAAKQAAERAISRQGSTSQQGGGAAEIARSTLPPRDPGRLRIATFNIQVFGISKESKPEVMEVLAETVRQFDIVAIQEIRCLDQELMERFVARVNRQGAAYDFVLGPRLGRTSSKEQYAFVYDSQRLAVDPRSVHTVSDPSDLLHREPLIARFHSRHNAGFSFTLINMHTDPDEADDEVNVLDDVFVSTRGDGRYEDDVILLGDLNRGHQRLGELGRVPGIYCSVQGQATNTLGTKSYDNIVFDPRATAEFTGQAGVLDLQQAFGMTLEQTQQVSDHLPVWAEFSVQEQAGSVAAGAAPVLR